MTEIPVRYSSDQDQARPPAEQIGHRIRIRLDGVPLPRPVVSYDIERGEIVWPVIDRAGNALLDPRNPGHWLYQTKRGKVEVELGDG